MPGGGNSVGKVLEGVNSHLGLRISLQNSPKGNLKVAASSDV